MSIIERGRGLTLQATGYLILCVLAQMLCLIIPVGQPSVEKIGILMKQSSLRTCHTDLFQVEGRGQGLFVCVFHGTITSFVVGLKYTPNILSETLFQEADDLFTTDIFLDVTKRPQFTSS